MHQELEMHKLQIEKQRLESQKAMQEERDRMQMEFGEAPDEDEDMMEPQQYETIPNDFYDGQIYH